MVSKQLPSSSVLLVSLLWHATTFKSRGLDSASQRVSSLGTEAGLRRMKWVCSSTKRVLASSLELEENIQANSVRQPKDNKQSAQDVQAAEYEIEAPD